MHYKSVQSNVQVATSVYLYYDAADMLLYVGVTSRGVKRQREHDGKVWWRHVARQEVEHYADRNTALARETELIQKHTPPFNVSQNPHVDVMQVVYLQREQMLYAQQHATGLDVMASIDGRVDLVAGREPTVMRTLLDAAVAAPSIAQDYTGRVVRVVSDKQEGYCHLQSIQILYGCIAEFRFTRAMPRCHWCRAILTLREGKRGRFVLWVKRVEFRPVDASVVHYIGRARI